MTDQPSTTHHQRRWTLPLTLVIGVTVVSGLLHGQMSQRWGYGEAMTAAANRLAVFPSHIGAWQQEEAYELSQSAVDLLDCQGYFYRGYRNDSFGDFIKLAVMVGPGSKMSVHVPEICFESNNFTLLEPRHKFQVQVGEQQHEFWGVTFQLNDVSQQKLRVIYAWYDGQSWVAPTMPRWSVAGSPVLYKLQLSYALNDIAHHDPAVSNERLKAFLEQVVRIWQQDGESTSDFDQPQRNTP